MDRGPSAAAVLAISVTALLVGCASGSRPAEPAAVPAAIALGPQLTLLSDPPTTDSVRAVPARDGSVHVLVASNGPRLVREIVVAPSGEVSHRRTVLSGVSVSSLDAAFDRQGRLHVLIDREHLVCEQGAWHKSTRTPWEGLAWKPAVARFVANAPDLVWSFAIDGREIGASGRWEVYGFGGYGVGIIWPWFTRGSRAVFVADSSTGFGPWIVIDPEGSMDTRTIDATADDEGRVYVTYTTSREGIAPASGRYSVKLGAEVLAGRDGVGWSRLGEDGSARALHAVKGIQIGAAAVVRGESADRPNYVPYPPHFFGGAVDSGVRMSTAVLQRPRALVIGQPRDKWLGRGFPVQYAEFDGVRWSSPIEVGLADHGGGVLFGGSIWRAYDLATTDDERTFIVWPIAQGIVGRWIDARH